MNEQDEHRYLHRGRIEPAESRDEPAAREQHVDVEQRAPATGRERARRVFVDWIFPLLVLGAIGAAIVYACLAADVVSLRK